MVERFTSVVFICERVSVCDVEYARQLFSTANPSMILKENSEPIAENGYEWALL